MEPVKKIKSTRNYISPSVDGPIGRKIGPRASTAWNSGASRKNRRLNKLRPTSMVTMKVPAARRVQVIGPSAPFGHVSLSGIVD